MTQVIYRCDMDKVDAARAHDAAIAEKLAEQGKTPEQVMFRSLDDAIALLDGTMVIYPDRYDHCFGFSLYRHLDHKPGMTIYEASERGLPELAGYVPVMSGGVIFSSELKDLDNLSFSQHYWTGWTLHT